jgi:hypothetical protein
MNNPIDHTLSPQQIFRRINANIKSCTISRSINTLSYITPFANSFNIFSASQIVTPTQKFVQFKQFSREYTDTISHYLVYVGRISDKGIVSGYFLNECKDGYYTCDIQGESIRTADLNKAEHFLYEKGYQSRS